MSVNGRSADAPAAQTPRVEMIGISQRFGPTTVLNDVSLTLQPSEIRGLVGQNGAGKSTLMKVLGGIYPDHDGIVRIDGEEVTLHNPREAQRAGIALIHQELSLVPSLTVAENIMLGIEPGRGLYSRKRTEAAVAEVLARVPMLQELSMRTPVGELGTGMQQRVEIAKVLSRDVKVLVMDEPTARLSGPERADLRDLMNQLSESGMSIIYISHFLEEIFESCTTVSILRNGSLVSEGRVEDYTLSSLTRAMLNADLVAEELDNTDREDKSFSGVPIVSLDDVSGSRIQDITLDIHEGEVVGLAGLVGSGRSTLAKTIAGVERVLDGKVSIDGTPVKLSSPRSALSKGITLIAEDRKTEGIVAILSAWRNMITMALERGMARGGFIPVKRAKGAVLKQFEELEVRPNDPYMPIGRFSGGNQQKILLGRVLLANPRLIVADQPTAGVDVGTKAQIHRLIREAAARGVGVLAVSDDLDELLAMCDRICVMRSGRIVSVYRRSELDRAGLVSAVAGA